MTDLEADDRQASKDVQNTVRQMVRDSCSSPHAMAELLGVNFFSVI